MQTDPDERHAALTALAKAVDSADAPLTRLVALHELACEVAVAMTQAIEAARAERCSWEDVGGALAITRQAAWARFAPRAAVTEREPRRHESSRSADPEPDDSVAATSDKRETSGRHQHPRAWAVALSYRRW